MREVDALRQGTRAQAQLVVTEYAGGAGQTVRNAKYSVHGISSTCLKVFHGLFKPSFVFNQAFVKHAHGCPQGIVVVGLSGHGLCT